MTKSKVEMDRTATLDEGLERALEEAYAAPVPACLKTALDERVHAALSLAVSRPSAPAARRTWWSRRRRLGLVPVLGLLLVVMVAAGSGLVSFYSDAGGYAWSHGQIIQQTVTVGGRRVTLERAYADVNQMMLAVTVADESNRVEPDARYDVEVADSTGQKWFRSAAFGSAADGDPTRRATVNWFEPDAAPAAPGTRQLTVVISHVQLTQPLEVASSAGPLPTIAPTGDDAQLEATFRFDLPVLPGAEASPNASAEHDGVTVTLSHVVVSPSMIRADVRWTGMPADTTGWTPGAGVWQHDGRTVAENWGSGRCEPTVCWLTTAGYQGSDTQQGQWTLTIDSFKGGSVKDIDTNTTGELPLVVAHGPFVIRFTIP